MRGAKTAALRRRLLNTGERLISQWRSEVTTGQRRRRRVSRGGGGRTAAGGEAGADGGGLPAVPPGRGPGGLRSYRPAPATFTENGPTSPTAATITQERAHTAQLSTGR